MLLVLSEDYVLVGLITVKDIEKARKYPDSNKVKKVRLRVGTAHLVLQQIYYHMQKY